MTDYVPEVEVGEMVGDGVVHTFLAGSAITKGQLVKLSDGTNLEVVPATLNSNVIGVALKAASSSGEYIPVLLHGIVKLTLGTVTGTLAAGSALKSDDDGKPIELADQPVDEGGSSTYTIYYNAKVGVSLQSGQTGDSILVKVEK